MTANLALLLQHLSPASDHKYGVVSSDYASYVHRSVLAQAVAHDDVWLDSERRPIFGQSNLSADQGKLSNDWRVRVVLGMRSIESGNERWEALASSERVKMLNMLLECGCITVQLQVHRLVRSALASEGESDWRWAGLSNRLGRIDLLQAGSQLLLQMGHIGGGNCHTMAVLVAACSRRVRKLGEIDIWMRVKMGNQALNVSCQRSFGLGRDGDDMSLARVGLRDVANRCLFQDHGRVPAGGTKVIDSCKPPLARYLRPRRHFERDVEVALVKVSGELGVDLRFDTDMWRDGVLLEHEKHLNQSRRPRSRLAMADVRLYSADVQGLVLVAALGERSIHFHNALHLLVVARLGTSAVELDIRHIQGIHAGLAKHLAGQIGLVAGVGVSDGDGFGRMVGSSTENDAQDVVIVCFGVFKSLDNKRPNAVRAAVPIGGGIPGLACVKSFGEEVAVAQTSETVWVGQHIDTASDRGIDLAVPKGLAGDLSQSISVF